LASAGVTAAKAKIIAEHLIIARIFAPKLEGHFEPQQSWLWWRQNQYLLSDHVRPARSHKTVAIVRVIARSMDKLVRLFPKAASRELKFCACGRNRTIPKPIEQLRRNPPRLAFAEQLRLRSPDWLILEINIGGLLAALVANDKAGIQFFDTKVEGSGERA
jgi:hypothetical protein